MFDKTLLKNGLEKITALLSSVMALKEASSEDEYLIDAEGRHCPLRIIKPIDLARHQLVMEITDKALEIEALLEQFKSNANDDVNAFNLVSASKYGVKKLGKKGGVSLFNHDGTRMIKITTSARFIFNEQLQVAKALLDELVAERSGDMDDMMKILVSDVFQVDKEGKLSRQRIMDLRRHNFEDPKWKLAMKAIDESFHPIDRRSYIQFYELIYPEGSKAKWRSVLLDLAKV